MDADYLRDPFHASAGGFGGEPSRSNLRAGGIQTSIRDARC
jgi:hypothetical protein